MKVKRYYEQGQMQGNDGIKCPVFSSASLACVYFGLICFVLRDDNRWRMAITSSNVKLCRDRMYMTRHVTDLPRDCRVGGLLVDYARLDELDECRRVVYDSATRADNTGLDEFHNDHDFEFLLHGSEIFAARSRDTGRCEAFIVIQPCLLTR